MKTPPKPFSIIAAVAAKGSGQFPCQVLSQANDGVIGMNNMLPWKLRTDMQRFVAKTRHKTVIMGRRTHESIGKPLPWRNNIVLSNNPKYEAKGCTVVHSIEEAIKAADEHESHQAPFENPEEEEIMIIGGEMVYRQFISLKRCTRLYLTMVDIAVPRDPGNPAHFPKQDASYWHVEKTVDVPQGPHDSHDMQFIDLRRITMP